MFFVKYFNRSNILKLKDEIEYLKSLLKDKQSYLEDIADQFDEEIISR